MEPDEKSKWVVAEFMRCNRDDVERKMLIQQEKHQEAWKISCLTAEIAARRRYLRGRDERASAFEFLWKDDNSR